MQESATYAWTWTRIWAIGFGVLIAVSLWRNDGHLIYSLDDPYIHLSVAETILDGGYGVNRDEYASPSSSILYPLLLTIPEFLGIGRFGPLLINGLAAGLSVWLLLAFFWRHAVPAGTDARARLVSLAAVFLMLTISAFALPLTGMEHALHILAVIVTIRGLVIMAEDGSISWSLILAVICMPLIRFEGVAMSGAALLAMLVAGHWRHALGAAAALAACLALYVATMDSLGLPILPSSVLVKSLVMATLVDSGGLAGTLRGFGVNLQEALLEHRWGLVFLLAVTASLASLHDGAGRWRSPASADVIIAGTMAVTLAAHLAAGRYGWFQRYEVYAFAAMVMSGIFLLRHPIAKIVARPLPPMQNVALMLGLVVLVFPYLSVTMGTPLGIRNVYEQQFQMHRFATDYFPRAVAVNDLGWVSYDNDRYVLDLAGLGSETARLQRAQQKLNARTITEMAAERGVDFAMVYPHWFQGMIPEEWCLLATLNTIRVTSSGSQVNFYATRREVVGEMTKALDAFEPTLPRPGMVQRFACPRTE